MVEALGGSMTDFPSYSILDQQPLDAVSLIFSYLTFKDIQLSLPILSKKWKLLCES